MKLGQIVFATLGLVAGTANAKDTKAPKSSSPKTTKKAAKSSERPNCPCSVFFKPDDFQFGSPFVYFDCDDGSGSTIVRMEMDDSFNFDPRGASADFVSFWVKEDASSDFDGYCITQIYSEGEIDNIVEIGLYQEDLDICEAELRASSLWNDNNCDGGNDNFP